MHVLAAISRRQLAFVMRQLRSERRRGRPWSRTLRHRVLIACAALRTNLTIRELAAVFQISKSMAHRIGVPELVTPTFRGRRIVRDSAWRRHCRRRARVEHAIGRLKVWRVLRDHRRRGCHLADTLGAVSLLHNLSLRFRDNP
ncbi:MAG TPA: hypothetical protein VFQ65_08835 [Kofleriaceae bacterium]|nr:hypothetical protein [Kofleriaceae bacterium]